MKHQVDLCVPSETGGGACFGPGSARYVACADPANLPEGYEGVAIRLVPQAGAEAGERVEIVLAHVDRGADLVLYAADHADDVIAEWQAFAERLSLPLMFEDADGVRSIAFPQLGALRVYEPRPRRRKAILSGRRPRFLTRRKTSSLPQRPKVLRDAREIIARN